MMYGSFVLSGIYKCSALISIGALARFVQLSAPLPLRNFRYIGHRALPHNKANQYAPGGAGRSLRSRRCLRR